MTMLKNLMFFAVVAVTLFCDSLWAAVSPIVKQPHIEVSLVSDVDTVKPGNKITLGLHLNPDEDWHVYWRNPGDSGMPPQITWELPAGVHANEIEWPFPHKIPVEHLVNYGYHDAVILPVTLSIPGDYGNDKIAINGRASWLVCQETCIPGSADLQLSLPVGERKSAGEEAQISKFQAMKPAVLPLLNGDVKVRENGLEIELYAKNLAFKDIKHVDFFAINEELIEYSQPANISWRNNYVAIKQPLSGSFSALPEVIKGVLVLDHTTAWQFEVENGGE